MEAERQSTNLIPDIELAELPLNDQSAILMQSISKMQI